MAGASIDVAFPAAIVIVAPVAKTVVPDGAIHTLLLTSPEETIVTAAPPCLEADVAKTVS